MSVSLSINKQCSRCPRVEQTAVTIEEAVKLAQKAQKNTAKAICIEMDGKETGSFEALCSTCQTIVLKYVENAMKVQKHVSSLRSTGADVEVEAE